MLPSFDLQQQSRARAQFCNAIYFSSIDFLYKAAKSELC